MTHFVSPHEVSSWQSPGRAIPAAMRTLDSKLLPRRHRAMAVYVRKSSRGTGLHKKRIKQQKSAPHNQLAEERAR
jgi:hypothetical protein